MLQTSIFGRAILTILLTGLAFGSFAYEPPSTPPDEAVRTAKIAFIGRVTAILELEHERGFSRAVASILVEVPLCGLGKSAGRHEVQVEFFSRYHSIEPGFPVTFNISDRVLVAFKQPANTRDGRLQFRSTFREGIDLAYVLVEDLQSDLSTTPLNFVSVFGLWQGKTTLGALQSAVQESS
jgi:hypothetical protein